MSSLLPSFSIQSESHPTLAPVELSTGSLSVGRGPLLRVTDRSVSRSHAKLSLDSATEKLVIQSVHSNPTFVYKVGFDKTVILNKNQEIELCNGDKFSFLPDKLFFHVLNPNKISSPEQTLLCHMGNDEINATQPIEGDLLELVNAETYRGETLFCHMGNEEINATQSIEGETLFCHMGNDEINATQPIEGDLLELVNTETDKGETLFCHMGNDEINATQPIEGDLLELVNAETYRGETLLCHMGNEEINATQSIEGETLFCHMGNEEINATQPIEGDLLELVNTETDKGETLLCHMGNDEINATQPIEGDLLELVNTEADKGETLLCHMGNEEINATQPIEGDLLELVNTEADKGETLLCHMGNEEINATQPVEGDLLELANAETDRGETLSCHMGNEEINDVNSDIERDSESETKMEQIPRLPDSDSSASNHVPHKKRKLPLWLLEDSKSDCQVSKKTKSHTKARASSSLSKNTSSAERDSTQLKPQLPAASSASDARDTVSIPSLPFDSGTVPLECSAALPSVSSPEPVPTPRASDECTSSVLPACPYGGDCYRRNPAHLKSYSHPPKVDRSKHTTATKECPYGSRCYRKNPDHLREFSHSPRGASARERKPRSAKAKKRSVLEGASDDDGAANSYDLRDDFIDNSGSSSESVSTDIESSESEEWKPSEEITDLKTEARDFVNNPKMIRK